MTLEQLKKFLRAKFKSLTDKEIDDMAAEQFKSASNELEFDEDTMNEIVKQVSERVSAASEEKFMKMLEKIEDKITKKIGLTGGDNDQEKLDAAGAPLRLARAVVAMKTGNYSVVSEYNKNSVELFKKAGVNITKAGYANEGNNADGGYLIPEPEFEAAVEKIIPVYGASLANATVTETIRNAIKTNKRGSNVTMYEVAEAGIKQASKLQISQVLVALREFAGIAIATDIEVDDAAIDFWQEVTEGFAEEMARIFDTMCFTENGTVYKGLLRMAGTQVVPVSGTIANLTWDHLSNAEVKVPTRVMQVGKWYMHRSIWNIVKLSKDSNGRYQWFSGMGLVTPWGTPVVLVDVMPDNLSVDSDGSTPYLVFGDLKRVKIYRKKGMQLMTSSEATVIDAASVSQNLFTQDMTALRATFRAVVLANKFPEAFAVIGTGNVS